MLAKIIHAGKKPAGMLVINADSLVIGGGGDRDKKSEVNGLSRYSTIVFILLFFFPMMVTMRPFENHHLIFATNRYFYRNHHFLDQLVNFNQIIRQRSPCTTTSLATSCST